MLAPAVLLLAVALTGCTDDSGDTGDAGDTSVPGDTGDSSATGDPGPRAAYDGECTTEPNTTEDGLTEPGSLLCFGTPAIVPAGTDGEDGRIEITTTAIDLPEGPQDQELRDRFGDDLEGGADSVRTVFHRIEFTVVEEAEPGILQDLDPTTFESTVVPDRGEVRGFVGIDPEQCRSQQLDDVIDDGGTPNDTVESCEWGFVDKDADVLGASYQTLGGDYDPLRGDPVRWAAP